MKIKCKHLDDHQVSWFVHFKQALTWVWRLQKASIGLFVHAFFPWLFVSYASSQLFEIFYEMKDIMENGYKK
jgi:hypothetical protein